MLSSPVRCLRNSASNRSLTRLRTATTQAQKRAGDISDAFVSLSGQDFKPLGPEYADLKRRLIRGHEDEVQESWNRLLRDLREEIPHVVELGSKVIPEIDFKDLDNPSEEFSSQLRSRGVAVVRGVVSDEEALKWKEDLREYIRQNPQTKAFPPDNPQVFELYWSRSQILARGHPNMLKTQRFLMSYWHSSPSAPISTQHPTSYADRMRMRLPGDAKFALGPHVDGGSVERWDERGYGLGDVYKDVWKGQWEKFDPWEAGCRLPVVSDLHQGVGACSMFRMYQGWLSMSTTGPFEGTLLVNPLLAKATAYYLLRPFFTPRKDPTGANTQSTSEALSQTDAFLAPENWQLESPITSALQGATPGHGQELSPILHPHLHLQNTMIHVPRVRPGDYVAWHCDTIHAVDQKHGGTSDSSVLYIPACPLTEGNARGLLNQRETFIQGTPSPDFGGGVGESEHKGRVKVEDMEGLVGVEACRAIGLKEWNSAVAGLEKGQREVLDRANKILGFYD